MFVQINSLRLHYQVEGQPQEGLSNEAPLVFINSLGCDLHIWDSVIPAFTSRHRIIRYDKRGHGLSDAPPGPYTIHDHRGDLAALLNSLKVKDVILIGISIGGLIAMEYAIQSPADVRALVLADTAPRIGTPERWIDRIAAVRIHGLDSIADRIVSGWFTPNFPQARPDEYRHSLEMLSQASPEGYTATCAVLRDTDLGGSIQEIRAPALVLCGAEDQGVTPEQTREWAACLPNARVELIAGAGHLACIEQPREMANRIKQFLSEDWNV